MLARAGEIQGDFKHKSSFFYKNN